MPTWIYYMAGTLLFVLIVLLLNSNKRNLDSEDGYLDPTTPVPPNDSDADDSDNLTQDDPVLPLPWQK